MGCKDVVFKLPRHLKKCGPQLKAKKNQAEAEIDAEVQPCD